MPTAIGFECAGGAVLGADRFSVRDGRIVSRSRRRVFGFAGEDCGGAFLADDPEALARRVTAGIEEYGTDRGDSPGIEPFAAIVADLAPEFGAEAVVAARDGEGVARVRTVGADGSVLEASPTALGSGSALALGRLEAADLDRDLDDAEALARDVFAGVAERDTATGAEADVRRLADRERNT